MVDVKALKELDAERLAKIQAVIDLFHVLGLSDEEISLLPQVLKNWPKVVETINAHSVDLANLKQGVPSGKTKNLDTSLDTPDNLRQMIGFGESPERVNFSDGGDRP